MQRRRQWGSSHHGGASAGLEESHLVVPANFVFHSNTAVELDQVGTDAKQNVLAVVDDFAGAGMLVGGGASAEVGTALEQGDAEAGVGEGTCGGEAGEAASGYGYGWSCGLDHAL